METEILNFLCKINKPVKISDLKNKINNNFDDVLLWKAIDNLLLEKKVFFVKHQIQYNNPQKFKQGRINVNSKGFGFVKDSNNQEFYVHKFYLNGAFNNDEVAFVIREKANYHSNTTSNKFKQEGQIVGIFNYHPHYVVGLIKKSRHQKYFLKVLSKNMHNFQADIVNQIAAKEHMVVKAEIMDINYRNNILQVKIVEKIGNYDKPGVDISMIIAEHNLPVDFSILALEDANNEISKIRDDSKYHNLTNECFVTIDGESAKDFDDAIFVKKNKDNNFVLKVAIADVASYVLPKTELDKEALKRGCSVYLLDRVIPMLPEILSNNVCSLMPNVPRYTMCCEIIIDNQGNVISKEIYQSQIRSHARLTYTEVNKLFMHKTNNINDKMVTEMLNISYELYLVLKNKKKSMGIVDLELQEPNFVIDKFGKIIDVVPVNRGDAEKLIESFMISANEAVAEIVEKLKLPFIYRVHGQPQAEKLNKLYTILGYLGIDLHHIPNKTIPAILEVCEKLDSYDIVANLILRSMEKAQYDLVNIGHFGLASASYTHFTSPIRRYPDLLVHRLLKMYIIDGHLTGLTKKNTEIINNVAQQANFTEERSVNCEREVNEMKLAQFMVDKVGQEFTGIIDGITSFGFFVQLNNLVEGLVRLTDLIDDRYSYHERSMKLIGQKKGKEYFMGQKVKIKVKKVDVVNYQIDFVLA